MACGVPVVATRVGGLPEVVEDGVSGHLFGIGALDEMAEGGIRLLEDPELHRSVAAAARLTAVERFTADTVVPRYEALYERVVG